MLGYLLGTAIVLAGLTPFIVTEIFADSFVVDFDKEQYVIGDSLIISGEILDFGMPRTRLLGGVYRFYFQRILPRLGALISGVKGPYQYLPDSFYTAVKKVIKITIEKNMTRF